MYSRGIPHPEQMHWPVVGLRVGSGSVDIFVKYQTMSYPCLPLGILEVEMLGDLKRTPRI